jgi:lipopolysaccharide export system protein LptA
MRYFFIAAIALLIVSTPVPAQVGTGYDTSLPIEITADSLEVQQDANIAIFRGTVDAVQGELNLRADQLTVHYKANTEGQNAIRLIEAVGDVFLSSPEEMAQGEKGVYNVEGDTVELFGSVVLTRGNNVIRGDHLVMNLTTGESRMLGGVKGTTGADGSKTETGDDGRVKALFVPSNDNSE